MVYKSVDHGKLWSICFFNNIFFLPKTTGTASHVTSFPWSIALDHTFYGFTGEITYAGYWENTRKPLNHEPNIKLNNFKFSMSLLAQ